MKRKVIGFATILLVLVCVSTAGLVRLAVNVEATTIPGTWQAHYSVMRENFNVLGLPQPDVSSEINYVKCADTIVLAGDGTFTQQIVVEGYQSPLMATGTWKSVQESQSQVELVMKGMIFLAPDASLEMFAQLPDVARVIRPPVGYAFLDELFFSTDTESIRFPQAGAVILYARTNYDFSRRLVLGVVGEERPGEFAQIAPGAP